MNFLFGGFRSPSPEEIKWRKQHTAERIAKAIPWDPKIKWVPELNIKADTYPVRHLFDIKTASDSQPAYCKKDELLLSPSGRFCYCEKLVKRGQKLDTYNGNKTGTVLFDGDVIIPAIHETCCYEPGGWHREPWMSLTPMEVMTLRGGTRLAKGDVVVAGLGLGHQLIEVSLRPKVTSLTLVEKNAELAEWIFPRLAPFLKMPVRVIIGDAYEELPKLTADVALVDIFPGYGNNLDDVNQLRDTCKDIQTIWGWGTAKISGGLW